MADFLGWLITFLILVSLVLSLAGTGTSEESAISLKAGLILTLVTSLVIWVLILVRS